MIHVNGVNSIREDKEKLGSNSTGTWKVTKMLAPEQHNQTKTAKGMWLVHIR